MTSVLRHHRYGRALGAGVLSVALFSGGTTGAFAATSTQTPTPTPTTTRSGLPTARPSITRSGVPTTRPSTTRTGMPTTRPSMTRTGMPTSRPSMTRTGMPTTRPSMRPSRTPTAMGAITVAANRKAVKVGNTVVFTGRVRGVRAGSTLVLQHMRNGTWSTLKYTGVVNRNGTYAIKRTFTTKGTHQVRVATRSGTFHSSPVTVTVS